MRSLFSIFLLGPALVFSKEPFKPNMGPELPSVTITCGDVSLMLRQASQWTPGRIDFKGAAMTTERSAYSTVFSFPDCGFIGTAHLENAPEHLESLAFVVDEKPVASPTPLLQCDSFRFERNSTIRNFELQCITEVKDNRLHETTTFHAKEDTPLKLVYHFMHAWKPTVFAYLAGTDAEPDKVLSGALNDSTETARKFFINQRVDWMAVYEPGSQQFAVSRLLSAPDAGGSTSMIWNVPGSYRKYYLKCFDNKTVPKGFNGTWKMVTAFGASPFQEWESAAKSLAAHLRP